MTAASSSVRAQLVALGLEMEEKTRQVAILRAQLRKAQLLVSETVTGAEERLKVRAPHLR